MTRDFRPAADGDTHLSTMARRPTRSRPTGAAPIAGMSAIRPWPQRITFFTHTRSGERELAKFDGGRHVRYWQPASDIRPISSGPIRLPIATVRCRHGNRHEAAWISRCLLGGAVAWPLTAQAQQPGTAAPPHSRPFARPLALRPALTYDLHRHVTRDSVSAQIKTTVRTA